MFAPPECHNFLTHIHLALCGLPVGLCQQVSNLTDQTLFGCLKMRCTNTMAKERGFGNFTMLQCNICNFWCIGRGRWSTEHWIHSHPEHSHGAAPWHSLHMAEATICECQAPLSCGKGMTESDTKVGRGRNSCFRLLNSCLRLLKEGSEHARKFHYLHVAGARCSSDSINVFYCVLMVFDAERAQSV